jgi:hypothetical protein
MKIYSATQIYIRTGVLVYHNIIDPHPMYSSGKILKSAFGKTYVYRKAPCIVTLLLRRLCCRF